MEVQAHSYLSSITVTDAGGEHALGPGSLLIIVTDAAAQQLLDHLGAPAIRCAPRPVVRRWQHE